MEDGVARSDADIAKVTGLTPQKASGARVALWEHGFVERVDKDENGHWRWRLCPPERRDEARQAYQDHREAREHSRLAAKPVGERATIVATLLSDDAVNAAVLEQLERSKAWRRAKGRANDVSAEKEAERRARRAEVRRARERNDPALDFLVTVDRLRDLIDALFAMRRQLDDERERIAHGEPARIPSARWPTVARNVREVLEVAQVYFRELADAMDEPITRCPLCGERLVNLDRNLGEGYIDAEAEEETDLAQA